MTEEEHYNQCAYKNTGENVMYTTIMSNYDYFKMKGNITYTVAVKV